MMFNESKDEPIYRTDSNSSELFYRMNDDYYELEEYKLPEGGFFDIVTIEEEEEEIENNYKRDSKKMNMVLSNGSSKGLSFVDQNDLRRGSRAGSINKRKAPPKPPRMSRSDSSASGSSGSNLSLSTTSSERKVCVNCNCDPDVHDMPMSDIIDTYKKNRMSLHDTNENVILHDGGDSDHYMWVPAGLDDHLVEDYMASLPRHRVPHFKNPDGIAYHNKQLIHQIPLHDSNFENVKSLKDDDRHTFNAFKRERDGQMDSGKVLVADDDYECTGCKKSIHHDELLVNAPPLGSEANWHPGCFECSQCEELLADLIFCHKDGTIYCVRHFGDQLKPRCCMCDELIFSGEYVRTDEKAYHADHFVCYVCERSLTGEQHLVDNALPICIACYDDKYASTCHMCHKTIGVDEEDVIYDDEHWHDHCLVCSLCSCRLSGTSFVIRDDNFLCSGCYQKTDDKRCKTCQKGFEPGAKRLELKGEFWHDTCFVCFLCKNPITSKKFIQHEGSQVCCPCFDQNFAKRCDKCKEVLREGGVACGGAFFHRDCFQCESCDASIANQAFQQKDGNRYCMPCYKQRYAKKCAGCSSYIVNGEYYTVDSDSWHKECFKCEVCLTVLQQQTFVQENGKVKLVCENCM